MTRFELRTFWPDHSHILQNQVSIEDVEFQGEKRRKYHVTLRNYVRGEIVDYVDLILWDEAIDDLIESLVRQKALRIG